MKKSLTHLSLILLAFLVQHATLFSQGCMPARHIPPNLGANGMSYLLSGDMEVGLSYRYLYSNTFFIGTEAQHQYKEQGLHSMYHNHSINLSARYSFTERFSLSVNAPLIKVKDSDIHYDGMRHQQKTPWLLGDVRVVGNYWLKDPLTANKGNISIGLGFKLPTGKDELNGTFFTENGPEQRDYDVALQPGDGGFGIILETSFYRQLSEQFSLLANAHYVINPRNTNTTVIQWFEPTDPFYSSVPDQFNVNLGMTYSFGQFAVSAGLRLDGMPTNDLIGKSDGFRRPGEILYLDNGLMWSNFTNTINLSVPLALHRNLKTNNLDRMLGIETLGGLADYLVVISYARRF